MEFRETHLCGPKHAVQALNYRFHQRQYQEQRCFSQGSEQFHGTARYPTTIHHNAQQLQTNHSFPPLSGHMHVQAPSCIYANNGYYSTYGPIQQQQPHYPHYTVPFQIPNPSMKPQYPTNGYCYANGYQSSAPGYGYPVPTGQLIELEHTYDVPDGHTNRRISITQSTETNRNKNENDYRINNNTEKEEGSGTFESWDYVYRNLESQGYSKDLGERGDILSSTKERNLASKEIKRLCKSTDLEETFANLNLIDKPLKTTDPLERHKHNNKTKESEKRNSNLTPTSSYDNLSTTEINSKKHASITNNKAAITATSKTLPRDKTDIKISKPSTSKTIDHRKSQKANDTEKSKIKEIKAKLNGNNNNNNSNNKWNCQACTYLNNSNAEICEMCYKSKTAVSQDMEVGGSQCPNCTLVNPKDLQKCDACGNTLKDSPTYI